MRVDPMVESTGLVSDFWTAIAIRMAVDGISPESGDIGRGPLATPENSPVTSFVSVISGTFHRSPAGFSPESGENPTNVGGPESTHALTQSHTGCQ